MGEGGKRMAVLVGCNYANTPNELHGCINDVVAMRAVLISRFGFDRTHVELLTDSPASPVMPTGANIKNALSRMAEQAQPGDVLFFHYSGHGTRVPSPWTAHPFKQDEAIVPCDFNLITDVDFRQLVNRLPAGATFTILSDSCHSGGLIDKEKEQIGPSSFNPKAAAPPHNYKPRAIPFQSVLDHLASLTSINTSDIGTHLLEFFGDEASLRFRIRHDLDDSSLWPLRADEGILLSGCQANETSADVSATEGGGTAFGAFSNAVQTVLREKKGLVSNREMVEMARKVLREQGITEQHPCLYCSDENADAAFLLEPAAET